MPPPTPHRYTASLTAAFAVTVSVSAIAAVPAGGGLFPDWSYLLVGMTTGALAWILYYARHRTEIRWLAFPQTIVLCAPFSIIGLAMVYGLRLSAPGSIVISFAAFSLFLGLAILYLAATQRQRLRLQLAYPDMAALAAIALLGGAVTAWLSVGIGEFVAFYLIARRYDVTEAVAVAVVLSALTVWSAAPVHLAADSAAVWPVVLIAGPGAVLGAVIARALALRLGALRLKRFFGLWLIVIGVVELLRNA